jgi:flagellar basal-body rod modification protein FlgD
VSPNDKKDFVMSQVTLPSQFLPSNPALQNSASKSLNELDSNDFLKLLIAELKNQDPMAPSDSVQMLQQISQIRQITSNDSMISTLDSVRMGQEVATAGQMVGKKIIALNAQKEEIEGLVDRVTISAAADGSNNRDILLHVGEHQVRMAQVRSIQPVADAAV